MAFSSLPQEVLQQIISSQSPTFANLRNYSLVCRNFSNVAREALYKHVDLTFDERGDEDTDEKTERRQLQLLTSIASHAHIGSNVRTFKNFHPWRVSYMQDVTLGTEEGRPETIFQAARNMKFLTKASIVESPVAIEVINNLQSYSRLTDLTITGFKPEEYIWAPFPTALKSLHWTSPMRYGDQRSPPHTAGFLIKVVQSTCPALESLDISLRGRSGMVLEHLERTATSTPQYEHVKISEAPTLTKLRHFGLKYEKAYAAEQVELDVLILTFVTQHRHTLKSVSIPVKYGTITRETTNFVLKVCATLPCLTELSLVETTGTRGGEQGITGIEFLTELTSALASPAREIERLSITNIKDSFSPDVGKLFASWRSLKFLRLGDIEAEFGPYVIDGRLDFSSYAPEILGFIIALPQSLQELYLEINGSDFFVEHDSDFDFICTFAFRIFNSLANLHTCDIHAWISDFDGGLGFIPEKAVFYRRLPVSKSRAGLHTKELWTSRMDCVDQESYQKVTKRREVVEGYFEGEDAEDVWLGGYTNDGELQDSYVDHSWPGWVNKLDNYPMFRRSTLSIG
ncbi:hypothetical protein N431DRAFT_378022 [Stipitochalara longipes BDJ]|nr:hypothetical protein N431DRAFT_378022 [Stipitochalara longipes BDJ]